MLCAMIHQVFYPIEIRGDNMSLFEIKDVSFQYDTKPVLKNVNMEFEPGKLYAIIGPSGTGKQMVIFYLKGKALKRWTCMSFVRNKWL